MWHFLLFRKHGQPEKPQRLSAVAHAVRTNSLHPADAPFLTMFLRNSTRHGELDSRLMAKHLSAIPPAMLWELKDELMKWKMPGGSFLSYQGAVKNLVYSASAVENFYRKLNCRRVGCPAMSSMQILASVAIYLQRLPERLAHVPSLHFLSHIGDTIRDFREILLERTSGPEFENSRLSCLRVLGSCFSEDKGRWYARMHNVDAKMICEVGGIVVKEGQELLVLFEFFSSLMMKGPKVSVFSHSLRQDSRQRRRLAYEACHRVFRQGAFPRFLLNDSLGTYSGEET